MVNNSKPVDFHVLEKVAERETGSQSIGPDSVLNWRLPMGWQTHFTRRLFQVTSFVQHRLVTQSCDGKHILSI